MGVEKTRRPDMSRSHREIFSSTNVSTGTVLRFPGSYTINAPSANATWKVGTPSKGSELHVYANTNSTKTITIQTNSTAHVPQGSTTNSWTLSTGQGSVHLRFLGLTSTSFSLDRVYSTQPFSTATSTGTILGESVGNARYVLSSTTAGSATWFIADPTKGREFSAYIDTSSTRDYVLITNSSAKTFHGSTNNKMTLTTGQGGVRVDFTALSTSKWAFQVLSRSTAQSVTLAAST